MSYSKLKYLFSFIILVLSIYFMYIDFLVPNWLYSILWFIFVIDIITVIIPKFAKHSSYGKYSKKFFKEAIYDKKELYDYKQKMKIRVLITLIAYIIFLTVIGVFYYLKLINKSHIILIVISLNFLDYFCINTWCVFHKIFIRDRCCNTCRIYNWDHFMKFTPLIFIPDFRAWSLFILGIISFLEWEICYFLHPERFTDISNDKLKCSNCKLNCRFKNKLS